MGSRATPTETCAALQTSDLGFAVGGVRILGGVHLTIAPGESVALVGPNGAGKTTLLRCILGTTRCTSGEVRVFDRPLGSYGRRELARRVSYVPQHAPEAAGFTVREFVAMGRYPHLRPLTRSGPEDERKVLEALRTTDTEMFADRQIDHLSGGERQRVLLAAALAQDSDVLLVDEPTAHLDYAHRAEVLEVLRHLSKDDGLTLLTVTHDLDQALEIADRLVALRDGSVEYDGAATEILEGDTLERIFSMRFDIVRHPRSGRPVVLPAGRLD